MAHTPKSHQPRQILIRPAVATDAKVLAEMVCELHAQQGALSVKFSSFEAMRDVLAEGAAVQALIAELDGVPVAFAFFMPTYDSCLAATGLSLTDFYLNETARAKSLGEPLMAACAAVARQKGAAFLSWTSKAWDVAAQDFNRKLGAIEEPVMAHKLSGGKLTALAEQGAHYFK